MGLRLVEPSGVFSSELTAILYALVYIKTHSTGRYNVLTHSLNSLSSVYALESRIISPKVHELFYQCKEAFWKPNEIGYEISIHLKNYVADFTFLVRRINVNRHTPSAYVFLL
jgi:hypothetical protein